MRSDLPQGWSFDRERRPPRMAIVAPPPAGRGTDEVEALSSWLPRVAAAIDLPPALMARYVLAPALGRGDVNGATPAEWGRYFSAMFRPVRGAIDGAARTALTWVAALEQLTGHGALRHLTLLPWAPALPPLRLTGRIRRVCPICLGNEDEGRPAYERLLWRLAPLEACTAHDQPVPLRDRCPHCRRVSPVLGAWMLPGKCSSCGAWLGESRDVEPDDRPAAELAWQKYVATQLRDLIRQGQALSQPPVPTATADAVRIAIDRTSRTMTAFAREVGYDLSTVSVWAAGRRQPSLEASLRICALGGFRLADFIRGDVQGAAGTPALQPSWFPPVARQRIDWAAVKRALRKAERTNPPPSLLDVLARLGVERREAMRVLPSLAARVRDRHWAWRSAELRAIRGSRVRAVRRAVRELWAEGVYPGRQRVERRLPRATRLRDPTNRAAWKQELQRLGLL